MTDLVARRQPHVKRIFLGYLLTSFSAFLSDHPPPFFLRPTHNGTHFKIYRLPNLLIDSFSYGLER